VLPVGAVVGSLGWPLVGSLDRGLFMSTRIKPLTVKFIEHVSKPGDYPDGRQLYLRVADDRKSKSWVQFFNRTKLGKKGRGELGLGSYPEVSLADAREKGGDARKLVAQGIDPVAHRKQERNKRWLADAKNKNFLAIAEDLIDIKSRGPLPWWCEERADGARNILNNKFKSLHELPINSAEAAEVITLKLYELLFAPVKHRVHKDRVGPRWLVTPTMAKTMKSLAYNIGERAHALKVLPISVANPAGEPLDALLTDRQPKGGHWAAIKYDQVPALYRRLDELSQPAPQDYFTVSEAARAVGKTTYCIKHAIRYKKLPAYKGEVTVDCVRRIASYEWRIKPADLFNIWPMVVDVIPGVRSVIWDLLKFCALNGQRPSEAREMRWDQFHEDTGLWIMSWTETKEGEHIEQDMVIPLSDPALAIVMKMKDIQRRYRMQTHYVFANYPSRFNAAAHIDQPASHVTLLENLRKALPPDQVKTTVHGFRTNFRSWGDDQRRPDGMRRFDEKDLERAIGHLAGFGKTQVSRSYSRQSSDIIGLIPIFDGWAKFVTSGGQGADVIPIRRRVHQGG
jgi:integrase